MTQDYLIMLVSDGDENGVGKGHRIYTYKNTKKIKEKLSLKKYNPIARKHTVYRETKRKK